MSARGALVLAIAVLIVLGAVAAWLVNVPLLAIGGLAAGAAWVGRYLVRRFDATSSRQKTET